MFRFDMIAEWYETRERCKDVVECWSLTRKLAKKGFFSQTQEALDLKGCLGNLGCKRFSVCQLKFLKMSSGLGLVLE